MSGNCQAAVRILAHFWAIRRDGAAFTIGASLDPEEVGMRSSVAGEQDPSSVGGPPDGEGEGPRCRTEGWLPAPAPG